MNRATAANTLIQDFKTWWTATYPAVPMAWPDIDFDPPASGNRWARMSLQWSGTVTAGAGVIEERHTGMVFVELFWPSGAGYRDVELAGEAVAAYFRTYSADGGRLNCGTSDRERPYVSNPPGEPGFTRRNVNVPIRLMERL